MSSLFTNDEPSPWHAGELWMQRGAGVVERMDGVGRRVIRSHLIEQHRLFYTELPFIVIGAVEPEGDVWATIRTGRPGFLSTPDLFRLTVAMRRDSADPADSGMNNGDAIGLLGIQLDTRRRNRLNGVISARDSVGFDVSVQESFGNCPRYINVRTLEFVGDPHYVGDPELSEKSDSLTAVAKDMIVAADSFFVASYIDQAGTSRRVDVSHRGGQPGFVRLEKNGSLTIPDYAGNLFFNTLGNFFINPRAGLVFVDWRHGDLLQMTGQVEIIVDSSQIASFEGAERLWRFFPMRIVHRRGVLPLRMKGAANSAEVCTKPEPNVD